jgi:hypothetical protein
MMLAVCGSGHRGLFHRFHCDVAAESAAWATAFAVGAGAVPSHSDSIRVNGMSLDPLRQYCLVVSNQSPAGTTQSHSSRDASLAVRPAVSSVDVSVHVSVGGISVSQRVNLPFKAGFIVSDGSSCVVVSDVGECSIAILGDGADLTIRHVSSRLHAVFRRTNSSLYLDVTVNSRGVLRDEPVEILDTQTGQSATVRICGEGSATPGSRSVRKCRLRGRSFHKFIWAFVVGCRMTLR